MEVMIVQVEYMIVMVFVVVALLKIVQVSVVVMLR
jgi:hypothetical protein